MLFNLFDRLRRLREMLALPYERQSKRDGFRARLALTHLEDRTVPTTVTISALVGSLGEAASSTPAWQLTRDGDTGSQATVFVSVGGTATSFSDFTPINSQVTFQVGQSTATVSLDPADDGTSEPTEVVTLTIIGGPYTIGNPSSVGINILDNDAQVVSVEQVEDASEDGYEGKFRFTRIGDLSGGLTVNYTVGGTATSGTDYTSIGTSVVFAANSATADVTVDAAHETLYDPDETVSVTVASGTGYSIGAQDDAELTIWDDAAHTFTLGGQTGAVWYDVALDEVDPEDDSQEVTLTNFTLTFAGQTFTEANATFTEQPPVGVHEYGDLVEIKFTVEFASPVAGFEKLIVEGGQVTGVDATTHLPGTPVNTADKARATLVLDFSGITIPNSGTTTWSVGGTFGDQSPPVSSIQLTSSSTALSVATAMESLLLDLGFDVKRDGTKLLIKGPPDKQLVSLLIQTNHVGATGPTLTERVKGTGQSEFPSFGWDNDGN